MPFLLTVKYWSDEICLSNLKQTPNPIVSSFYWAISVIFLINIESVSKNTSSPICLSPINIMWINYYMTCSSLEKQYYLEIL